MTARQVTCPRCGDWTIEVLDADGWICECDGPFGCGFAWVESESSMHLALEIERMQAMLEELPPDYWPSWLSRHIAERKRVHPRGAPRPPRDCDGQELHLGDWVHLVTPFGEPERGEGKRQGEIVEIGASPFWAGGWPITVRIDGEPLNCRSDHQVRIANRPRSRPNAGVFARLRGHQ